MYISAKWRRTGDMVEAESEGVDGEPVRRRTS